MVRRGKLRERSNPIKLRLLRRSFHSLLAMTVERKVSTQSLSSRQRQVCLRHDTISVEALKLEESLKNIQARIKSAAERSGRNPDDITIVVVTKTVGLDALKALSELGWKDIGENRVQDALNKAKVLTGNQFTWHMIGHLQTNKVKRAIGLFDYIHSLDSIRLAEEIHKEAQKINKIVKVLIEVNVSAEASKSGIKPEEVADFYKKVKEIVSQGLQGGMIIAGLMTMAPITDNPETVRPYFRRLKELLDELRNNSINNSGHPEELKYLSMGMSQDFEVAVEEGANIVRIGSAIFNT